jgi:hypothetical protein
MNNSSDRDNFAVPVPITQWERDISQRFAKEQTDLAKADRILLNTLAVLAVKDYLQMMEIPTSLNNRDCWNSMMRCCTDAADLEIANLGIVECRPIRFNEKKCPISAEVWHDRIGYLVVEITEDLQEAKILGFVERVTEEEIAIEELHSPEYFLEYLAKLSLVAKTRTNLSQWMQGVFGSDWQDLLSFINSDRSNLARSFRGSNEIVLLPSNRGIRRGKLLVVDRELSEYSLLLIVNLEENNDTDTVDRKLQITLQLHSLDCVHLPEGLELQIIDAADKIVVNTKARKRDNYLQFDIRGNIGEFFSIKINLGECEIREDFVV